MYRASFLFSQWSLLFCHDAQQNVTQYDDTNDTQHNDIHCKMILKAWHNDNQQNDAYHNNTHYKNIYRRQQQPATQLNNLKHCWISQLCLLPTMLSAVMPSAILLNVMVPFAIQHLTQRSLKIF